MSFLLRIVDLASFPNEAEGSSQVLQLRLRVSQIEDLSYSDPVLAVKDRVRSNKFSTIFFQLLAPLGQG